MQHCHSFTEIGMDSLDNANPEVHGTTEERLITDTELDDNVEDEFDSREVFDILRRKSHQNHKFLGYPVAGFSQ